MDDAESIYAYAFGHYEAGNLTQAAESFRLLCFQHPFEGKFWFGLAATLQESKSYPLALEAWAVAAILKPSDPFPHFHAAECYFSLNNLQEASLALEEAELRSTQENPLQDKISLLRELWNLNKESVCL